MFTPKGIISGCDIAKGHTELALQTIRDWEKDFPPAQVYEAMAQARAGNKEEALRLLRPYEEKYPNPGVALQWFALAYAALRDEPNAVKWLERSAEHHEWQALNMAVNPAFASIRKSEDFRALEKKLGLLQ